MSDLTDGLIKHSKNVRREVLQRVINVCSRMIVDRRDDTLRVTLEIANLVDLLKSVIEKKHTGVQGEDLGEVCLLALTLDELNFEYSVFLALAEDNDRMKEIFDAFVEAHGRTYPKQLLVDDDGVLQSEYVFEPPRRRASDFGDALPELTKRVKELEDKMAANPDAQEFKRLLGAARRLLSEVQGWHTSAEGKVVTLMGEIKAHREAMDVSSREFQAVSSEVSRVHGDIERKLKTAEEAAREALSHRDGAERILNLMGERQGEMRVLEDAVDGANADYALKVKLFDDHVRGVFAEFEHNREAAEKAAREAEAAASRASASAAAVGNRISEATAEARTTAQGLAKAAESQVTLARGHADTAARAQAQAETSAQRSREQADASHTAAERADGLLKEVKKAVSGVVPTDDSSNWLAYGLLAAIILGLVLRFTM